MRPLPSAQTRVSGQVFDPQQQAVAGAAIQLKSVSAPFASVETATDEQGRYEIRLASGAYSLNAQAPGFVLKSQEIRVLAGEDLHLDLHFDELAQQNSSIVITGNTMEPAIDLRNAEIFNRTLFTRDDQVFQQLDAGINAGQHEGGGKSLEIRRFEFNLDHGGVNGGLKVLIDDVQQNQGTQGHGQGYLGSLKALSPELIQDVTIINGPFSAEYGDFSGLGVVHIRQRESLPEEFTVRLQGGNLDTGRTFLAYSPDVQKVDAYLAYEGSYTNGPFENRLRYRRDNLNTNYTKTVNDNEKIGVRLLFGRNDFYSSGQIPLDLVDEGILNRFGYVDPTDGGRVKLGTVAAYYSKALGNGDTFRADGFLSRSLFDLYANFTYYLNDPIHGDAFQQHDSRLQQGANAQYTHPHRLGRAAAVLVAGMNFDDNQINVGLYPREGRVPTGVTTRADAHVTNEAGYVQENVSFWQGRLLLGGGLRYDEFRYDVRNHAAPLESGSQWTGRWQAKGSAAFTPAHSLPLTIHLNYGRGINSADARGVVEQADETRLATTDFYQFAMSSNIGRFSISNDVFLIDHSNEQAYIPDDGSLEFKGPSRAYGLESKLSIALTRHLSLNGGLTKVGNAFYRGGEHRVYVDNAPHFVANAGLVLAGWHGWSGSVEMRAINHYRLDGQAPSILALGHTVFNLGLARPIRRGIELSLSLDNLTNRDYYETQNYFNSRVTPIAPVVARIHGTAGYPLTAAVGVTFRIRGK
ncbi:MAG: hypothetical protein DMG58_07195 [Acidobacteria bacterium]|nr:MAG: hypothetical protein DMG58_07195 [Acidobacteriota bacterium]